MCGRFREDPHPVLGVLGLVADVSFVAVVYIWPFVGGATIDTTTDAALAAGIFHRKEVKIEEVKAYISSKGIQIRV